MTGATDSPSASLLETPLTRHAHIRLPIIGGAMYPCSNAELVAAVSEAGGIGVVQPMSLTYVRRLDLREALRKIQASTSNPIGMNVLIEKSSRIYLDRVTRWVDVAVEEGIRFFVTSLGNPRWVVDRVAAVGGIVYHDVTERKWALKAADGGVHGLIAVNRRAGGHAGHVGTEELFEQVGDMGLPAVCAGGVGDERDFVRALRLGYAGVQIGTRLIATTECDASQHYKEAIVAAAESDIVLTERVTGVPLAVINTPHVERVGTKVGPIARMMFRQRRTKHLIRTFYALRSAWRLKRSNFASTTATTTKDYWQAGRSVAGVKSIEPVATILTRFAAAARE